jgi:hypothetical protein
MHQIEGKREAAAVANLILVMLAAKQVSNKAAKAAQKMRRRAQKAESMAVANHDAVFVAISAAACAQSCSIAAGIAIAAWQASSEAATASKSASLEADEMVAGAVALVTQAKHQRRECSRTAAQIAYDATAAARRVNVAALAASQQCSLAVILQSVHRGHQGRALAMTKREQRKARTASAISSKPGSSRSG